MGDAIVQKLEQVSIQTDGSDVDFSNSDDEYSHDLDNPIGEDTVMGDKEDEGEGEDSHDLDNPLEEDTMGDQEDEGEEEDVREEEDVGEEEEDVREEEGSKEDEKEEEDEDPEECGESKDDDVGGPFVTPLTQKAVDDAVQSTIDDLAYTHEQQKLKRSQTVRIQEVKRTFRMVKQQEHYLRAGRCCYWYRKQVGMNFFFFPFPYNFNHLTKELRSYPPEHILWFELDKKRKVGVLLETSHNWSKGLRRNELGTSRTAD